MEDKQSSDGAPINVLSPSDAIPNVSEVVGLDFAPAVVPNLQQILAPVWPSQSVPAVKSTPAVLPLGFAVSRAGEPATSEIGTETILVPAVPVPSEPAPVAMAVSSQPGNSPPTTPVRALPPNLFRARLPRWSWQRVGQAAVQAALGVLAAFAIWLGIMIALISLIRFVDPPLSMLMLMQRLSGQELHHSFVPLEAISPNLRRAVITSEDARFCNHWGFDLGEIKAALRSGDGSGRGASTITQQVAKNLFLWPGKSYLRKGLEVPLTLAIEALWPKRRTLEVYLNIAEWGPGVFGAEAAAQYYFSRPAARLSEREAALMAVALPNPIARDASDPDPAVARRATRLLARMRLPGARNCVLNVTPPREVEP